MKLQDLFSTKSVSGSSASIGLLLLRIAISAMMLTHGMTKLSNFSELSQHFDPIGIGGSLSLSLVIFAEVFCSIAVMLGLFTRLCVIPLMFAMCVAIFIFLAGEPFAAKELALLYLSFYVVLLIVGPGRYSIDRLLWK
ncbi:MAG: DoxX family protein [Marinilabiliaceae bacterium]|nr:DoxX family protein [Marinilabiliaceae bacterium]